MDTKMHLNYEDKLLLAEVILQQIDRVKIDIESWERAELDCTYSKRYLERLKKMYARVTED